MESLLKKHHPELYAKLQKEEKSKFTKITGIKTKEDSRPTKKQIKAYNNRSLDIDLRPNGKTYVKDGTLYDNGIAIDICGSGRDYDY